MKKTIASIILVFMLSLLLVGCVTPQVGGGDGGELEGVVGGDNTESGNNDPENGGETPESPEDKPTETPENPDNPEDNPTETPTDPENGDNKPADDPENPDISGGEPTDTPENPDNPEDNPTENPENPGNPEDNPTETPEDKPTESPETPEQGDPPKPAPEIGNKVGDLMMNISLDRVDGGTVKTSDYRGKIVILNIWATWCPPCKAELPDFNRIASEYADDVVIIAAHDSYGKAAAPGYINSNFPDSDIIFAYDTNDGLAFYAAGAGEYIPRTAIADQNGVIVYSNYGILSHAQLVSIIESLISNE